mgnify:CR=1 FL=1
MAKVRRNCVRCNNSSSARDGSKMYFSSALDFPVGGLKMHFASTLDFPGGGTLHFASALD